MYFGLFSEHLKVWDPGPKLLRTLNYFLDLKKKILKKVLAEKKLFTRDA